VDSLANRLNLRAGLSFPKFILDVSIEFDEHLRAGKLAGYQPIPTGFEPLDSLTGGGLHAEWLMLVGGAPGVGKTIFALRSARNIAASP
jgi:replicative DNA helicase